MYRNMEIVDKKYEEIYMKMFFSTTNSVDKAWLYVALKITYNDVIDMNQVINNRFKLNKYHVIIIC